MRRIITAIIFFGTGFTTFAQQDLRLWYREPANASAMDSKNPWESDPEWLKALPIGNGFLGTMVFGDVNKEKVQLKEKSLWSGSADDNNNPEVFKSLAEIRQLLFEGRYKEANALTEKTQVCKGPLDQAVVPMAVIKPWVICSSILFTLPIHLSPVQNTCYGAIS